MLTRRQALLLGLGLTSGPLIHDAAAQPAEGQVTVLAGTARAMAGGAERSLAVGDPISVGDLVQTGQGSRLTMKLGRDTLIRLGAATSLRIEKHLVEAGGQLELIDGSMFLEHTRPATEKPGRAEVRSPYGLIAVRGTRFFAGTVKGQFGVFLAEGLVDVTAAQRTVTLRPGLGTFIAKPGAAPTPARAWAAPTIAEALTRATGAPTLPR